MFVKLILLPMYHVPCKVLRDVLIMLLGTMHPNKNLLLHYCPNFTLFQVTDKVKTATNPYMFVNVGFIAFVRFSQTRSVKRTIRSVKIIMCNIYIYKIFKKSTDFKDQ